MKELPGEAAIPRGAAGGVLHDDDHAPDIPRPRRDQTAPGFVSPGIVTQHTEAICDQSAGRDTVIRNYELAPGTYQEAAANGDRTAPYKLGMMYALGLGVARDYPSAVRWYREAAERGLPEAQTNLGHMYGTGRGVPRDYVSAYAWYSVSAATGNETARRNRDTLARSMGNAQLAEAQQMSRDIFARIEAD